MRAQELMTADPQVVTPHEPISIAARLMERLGLALLPVVRDRESMRLVGVITDRDIALRHVAKRHIEDCDVGEHMTRANLDVVHPDADVRDVVGRMRRTRARHVPVVGSGKRLLGIISIRDLARRTDALGAGAVTEVLRDVAPEPRPRE